MVTNWRLQLWRRLSLVKCGRCSRRVREVKAETCWWCTEPLCYDCWDRHGHCGHPEAEEMNRKARLVKQPNTLKDGTE